MKRKTKSIGLCLLLVLALLFCSIVLVTANNYQGFIYAQF